MTQPRPRNLVVLPPVAADPVFSEPLPLAQLIPAPRLGCDPQDFAALFIRHQWSFSLHARRFLSDQRDIDEVVQEGFLKLFLALPELDTELQALAYCRRTITNLCIDRYRADQRRPHLIDLEKILEHPPAEEDDTDPLIQAEDAVIVREALAMLSPLHRAALVKREVEEKSLPQIALELDLPVEQVKHVLHRARRALRRLLVGTHVEPGVDLDVAMVLAATKDRAVRAAKPTGAASLAILLVLAGYVGLRPTDPPQLLQGTTTTLPFTSLFPVQGTLSAPNSTLSPAPGPSPARSGAAAVRTAPAPGHHASPLRSSQASAPVSSAPTGAPSARPTSTPPSLPPRPRPSSTGVPVPAPSPPPIAPADDYAISGVGSSGPPELSNQQSNLRSFGSTSSSLLSVDTADGVYELRQAFTFTHDGRLLGVSLHERVPVAQQAAVSTMVASTSSSVHRGVDGAIRIRSSGLAVPVDAAAPRVARHLLTVDITLAADLTEVLTERVTVTRPDEQPSHPPAPGPTPNGPPTGLGSPVEPLVASPGRGSRLPRN